MVNFLHRIWNSLPFLISLLVLSFLVWAGLQSSLYPYDGIIGYQLSGLINNVDATGPSAGLLKRGDIIISVNGIPVEQAFPFHSGKKGGDRVQFLVERNGHHIPVTITLIDPSLEELSSRLVPFVVALLFSLMGIGVQTFRPPGSSRTVAFLFFQINSIILVAGAISYTAPTWTSILFNIALLIVGPLTIHFHLQLPQIKPLRYGRFYLSLLYASAILGALIYVVSTLGILGISSELPDVSVWIRLYLGVNLLAVIGLLVYAYRNSSMPGTRGIIRIVVLGGFLSLLPLVTLTILPEALSIEPILPQPLAFLLLSILPLTYGYAIFRHHLIEIEEHVNRGATFILVYSILGACYLVLYAALTRLLPINMVEKPFVNTVLVLFLASIFSPFRQKVQQIVDTAFYGGWYDYRTAVRQITQGLEQITDLQELAKQISERLVKTLRLEDTCAFLRDHQGEFSVIDVCPRRDAFQKPSLSFPLLPRSSLAFLLTMGEAGGRSSMQEALKGVILSPEEQELLNSEQVHLWVPIIGHEHVQGYLALGPKFGGDIFSGEDMDILRAVATQMAPVIENIHLLSQLRQYASELEQRVEKRTAELHDAKERLEAILSSVGDGVFVTGLDGRIVTVNLAYQEQSGYAAREVVGQRFEMLLIEHNDPVILEEMQSTLLMKQVWSGNLVQERKDGKQYDIQLTMAPVVNQESEVIGYVGSQRDITKQRELDRLKDQFISDVSHELRTPATNLSLYIDLMEHSGPEKHGEYLPILKGQCNLLTKMVEDILDLSRLEVEKSKKVEFTLVDINLLTEQVVTAHYPLAAASDLDLIFEPDTNLSPVYGLQQQLVRVINNLVSNAIRYTQKGEVRVRTYQRDGNAVLEVQDTGIGIDLADQAHIFERFYRGRQVRQSRIHGTGLGLAIVREIVELHGGSISVESQTGQGSRFQISLPFNKEVSLSEALAK